MYYIDKICIGMDGSALFLCLRSGLLSLFAFFLYLTVCLIKYTITKQTDGCNKMFYTFLLYSKMYNWIGIWYLIK